MTRQHTLPPDWSPRHYRDGDDEGVLQLLQAAFDGWPKFDVGVPAIDHLRWKVTSHHQARRLSVVGQLAGRTIAWQGYWLMRIKLGDSVLLAKQCVDFCVHPDFQRLGLRGKCYQFSRGTPRRNFQLNFDVESGHPAMKRAEERIAGPQTAYLANKAQALVWRRSDVSETGHASASNALFGAGPNWLIHEAAEFDERVDAFWTEASRPFQLIAVRDSQFLNWRYADTRAGDFTIRTAEHAGDVLGYIVTCLRQRGRGCIADVLALPGRVDVATALVTEAVAALTTAGAAKIECWLPTHHPYQPVFASLGFRPRGRPVPFTVQAALEHTSEIDMAFRADPSAAIHVAMGDSDLV